MMFSKGATGVDQGRKPTACANADHVRALSAAGKSTRAYQSLTVPTWAICSAVASVSHARLDRVAVGRSFASESLSGADLARIEAGLRHAFGLV